MSADFRDVRIDSEVYALVQDTAVPFEDDFNSALRRMLGLGGKPVLNGGPNRKRSGRAKPGEILPFDSYEQPLLEALVEAGGQGHAPDIIDRIGEKLNGRLVGADLEPIPSGRHIRWRHRAQWTQHRLKRDGYTASDGRGLWEITPKGRHYLDELNQED
jgi:hypothetical protein